MLSTSDPIIFNSLQSQLLPDEQVRWAALETQAGYLSRLAVNIRLPLLWIVFSGCLLFLALSGKIEGSEITLYFLGGFVLVGLFLLIMALRLFWLGGRKAYVVTNQAAFVFDSGTKPQQVVQRFDPQMLQTIEIRPRKDGSGDLVFDRAVVYTAASKGRRQRSIVKIGFIATPQAIDAYRWIRRIPGVPEPPVEPLEGWDYTYEQIRVIETAAIREREYVLIFAGTALCGANLSSEARFIETSGKQARWGRESKLFDYRSIDPLSQAFLDADAENFRIPRSELQKIVLHEAYHTYRGDQRTSGQVSFHLVNGRQRRFILLGDLNIDQLAARLRTLTAQVEVVSKNAIIADEALKS